MTRLNSLIFLVGGSAAISIVVKATVIAALGLVGAWLGRGSRAAVRHAVLAACFAALLGLPVASLLIPPMHLAVVQAPTVAFPFAEAVDTTLPSAPMNVNAPSVSQWSLPSPGDLWIVGTLLFLLRIIVGLRQVYLLRRFGLPWRDGRIVVERMAAEAGVHRRIDVLLHESLVVPVTCGVVYPAIVLPPDARNWDGEDLGRAIVHELEHVRRWDWVSQCFARAVCAAYWFHPLVWIASRQFSLEAERACDDAVLRRSEATAYADQLVALAQRLSTAGKSPALAMAGRSDLSSRVRAVLDGRQKRGRAGVFLVTVACTVAAVAVLAMSPIRMVAAPQPSALRFEAASIRPTPPPPEGGVSRGRFVQDASGIDYFSIPVFTLILRAWNLHDYELSMAGGFKQRWNIVARAPENATVDQIPLMLRGLLIDRFGLKFHREKRDIAVYALVPGKGSPKLKEAEAPEGGLGTGRSPNGGVRVSGNVTLEGFGYGISEIMGRPVIDQTGLTGVYEISFNYDRDDSAPGAAANLQRAIEDNLGLKVEPRKVPIEVFVVDSVNSVPSAN
jgi:uncharacterized protein (TIGR03435 family)